MDLCYAPTNSLILLVHCSKSITNAHYIVLRHKHAIKGSKQMTKVHTLITHFLPPDKYISSSPNEDVQRY